MATRVWWQIICRHRKRQGLFYAAFRADATDWHPARSHGKYFAFARRQCRHLDLGSLPTITLISPPVPAPGSPARGSTPTAARRLALRVQPVGNGLQGKPVVPHFRHHRLQIGVGFAGFRRDRLPRGGSGLNQRSRPNVFLAVPVPRPGRSKQRTARSAALIRALMPAPTIHSPTEPLPVYRLG